MARGVSIGDLNKDFVVFSNISNSKKIEGDESAKKLKEKVESMNGLFLSVTNDYCDKLLSDFIEFNNRNVKVSGEVLEFIKNPDEISKALEIALNLDKKMHETIVDMNEGDYQWDGWFSLKEMVDYTTVSYKIAGDTLDKLKLFGFLVEKEHEGRKYFRMFLTEGEILEYFSLIREELNEKSKQMTVLINNTKRNNPFKRLEDKSDITN